MMMSVKKIKKESKIKQKHKNSYHCSGIYKVLTFLIFLSFENKFFENYYCLKGVTSLKSVIALCLCALFFGSVRVFAGYGNF
jgi:hypothetical protein